MKVFSNMKRSTKGFSGQAVALFPTMLDDTEPIPLPSRITSSPSPTPSPSPEPTPVHTPSPTQHSPTQPSPKQPSPTQSSQPHPLPDAEHHVPTPHESPLHAVHSHRSDEEDDLKNTKLTYSSAFTKLILNIKKLESTVKTGKARKRARLCFQRIKK
ncbi:hypothetical protein Tco_0274583, partial [Tanacetum coccineum]